MRARAGHTPPKHQAIHHAVSGEAMPLMWDCIQQLVQQPGLRDFCDVTIFISAKNLKANTRQSTLQSTWTNFFGRWEDVLDWNALDPARMWFDIGKETCTRTSLLAQNISTQPRPVPTLTPTTSMWRPCCLEEYCQSPIYAPGRVSSFQRMYYTALAADLVSMTVTPPRSSPAFHHGLVYSQFYNSFKETVDAAKAVPFQDQALETLALDPAIVAAVQHTGHAVNHSQNRLIQSYLQSKKRCAVALADSDMRSFGTREEHRMSYRLASRVVILHTALSQGPDQVTVLPSHRPHWSLATKLFTRFMRSNINRFAAGFEYTRALSTAQPHISWERMLVMTIFLRMLRLASSSHLLAPHSAVWKERTPPSATRPERFGLGVSMTLPECRYAFLLEHVQWRDLTLVHQVTSSLFAANHFTQSFRRHGREVGANVGFTQAVEALFTVLPIEKARAPVADEVPRWLLEIFINLLFRQFQRDVWSPILKLVREEFREDVLDSAFSLCHHTLQSVLIPTGDHPHPSYHIGSSLTLKYHDPCALAWFLWDYDDDETRAHWDKKTYRVLFRRVCEEIGRHYPPSQVTRFKSVTVCRFVTLHWIMPYPSSKAFWQHANGPRQKMWVSLTSSGIKSHSPHYRNRDRSPMHCTEAHRIAGYSPVSALNRRKRPKGPTKSPGYDPRFTINVYGAVTTRELIGPRRIELETLLTAVRRAPSLSGWETLIGRMPRNIKLHQEGQAQAS
jgi:hypothetical protein